VFADIATPQFPARGVIDPQDPNDLALFVHFKDDTVRLMENLPQSPGPERRLRQQRAATRALFQRKERIQQAVPPPFGPEGVALLAADIFDEVFGVGERSFRNVNSKGQALLRAG
jgi:hypothetical protein